MPASRAGAQEAPPGPAHRQQVRLRVPAVRFAGGRQGGSRPHRVPRDNPRGRGRGEPAPAGRGPDPPPATPRVTGPATPGRTAAGPGDARAYHQATKHSWTSVRSSNHALDWTNKPFPFKV